METTTINKSLTEALSSTGFVKIEASRKESEPFQHIDAYIYDAGTRIGYASVDRGKKALFLPRIPGQPYRRGMDKRVYEGAKRFRQDI